MHHLLIKVGFQDSFQGDWRFLYFQGAEKKTSLLHRWRANLCRQRFCSSPCCWPDNFGMFFARWLLAKIHGGLLPQKHGQNLCLSCPLLWLLGPNIIKQTLYLVCGRPWAACSMDVVSFSITSKCTRTCDT